jgi:hypothetical protein
MGLSVFLLRPSLDVVSVRTKTTLSRVSFSGSPLRIGFRVTGFEWSRELLGN